MLHIIVPVRCSGCKCTHAAAVSPGHPYLGLDVRTCFRGIIGQAALVHICVHLCMQCRKLA
eukprot:scaffold110394_cov37-Prasinocladus_malaysianus.AAC.1